MPSQLSVTFTGLQFDNPFLLASAPPTESDSNIMRAMLDSPHLSMQKRPGTALHSSWNWELISDKTLDWWVPRIARIKQAFPDRVLIASIMAGSGNDKELDHWRTLARACQDEGADGLELNLSCPHMDRED